MAACGDRGDGYGDEGAECERSGGDGQHEHQWVEAQGVAQDRGLEHVAREVLDQEDEAEHEGCGEQPVVCEGDQDGQHAGGDGAHDREEAAEEGQDCERDAEEQQAQADPRRVGEGDQELSPEGARLGGPGGGELRADLWLSDGWAPFDRAADQSRAVLEVAEEHDEQ